jgi:predicted thioesterase
VSSPADSTERGKPLVGAEATVEKVIPHEWTLAAFDPHLPPVLSTPAMIGMMEVAAARLARYEGRFLIFDVEARTAKVTLGRGRVFRAIVEPKSFSARADVRGRHTE